MNEDAFRDGLRSAATGAGAPTLTLDDVRGRARSIRRRRTAAGATGAAALVAAAVVPIALLVGGGSSTDTLPPADATPTVSDTANPVAPAVDQRGSWVEGDTIHPADGEPFTPDVSGDLTSVVGLADGRWAMTVFDAGAAALVVTDSSGQVLATHEALDGVLAVDDAHESVAWIAPDARVRVLVPGRTEPLVLPGELSTRLSPPEPTEVLPGCDPVECVVLVETWGLTEDGREDSEVDLDGGVRPLDRLGLLSITDVSPDGASVAGLVDVDELDQRFCSAVVDLATGEERWRSCEVGSFRFSPDGTEVLAIDSQAEGFGHSFVEVREALTGEVVGRYGGGTVFDEAWASSDQFLVSQQLGDGTNQLLRVEADGSLQTVFVQVAGTPGDPSPLRLAGP